jgi:hypothetical protein
MRQIFTFMKKYDIHYFSATIFQNEQVLISSCNNPQWLRIYKQKYQHQVPPVQKYLTSLKQQIIVWDSLALDHETKEYIALRNQITDTEHYVSLLIDHGSHLTTFTFGSKNHVSEIYQFLHDHYESMRTFERSLSVEIVKFSNVV